MKHLAKAVEDREREMILAALDRLKQSLPPLRPHGLTEAERMEAYKMPAAEAGSIVTLGAVVAAAVSTLFLLSPLGGFSWAS